MTAPLLLGIDLGTSSTKTIVMTPGGRVLASAAEEYPVESPRPGWAEQDPRAWFHAFVKTTRQVLGHPEVSPQDIAGIGLSGQMHGAVCLDAQGRVLRPAIIWADRRSQGQVESVLEAVGRERLGEWTGNPLATGFMLPTWLWLREQEPDIARGTTHLLLPKDYLRYRMTGEVGSEPSDASSTLLFDPVNKSWSVDLLDTLAIDPVILPPVHRSSDVAGMMISDVARVAGLRAGTPVVCGGSDQACQALGNGVIDPGVISCTIGSGGQLFAPASTPAYDRLLRLHLFCHVLPDRWHTEAATLSAGLSLRWLRDKILIGYSYQDLADLAARANPGAEGLLFLPYLQGERTPHMDPHARGGFIGLALHHRPRHLIRAVMEGVVFSLRQAFEIMLSMGIPAERIIASGGATRHPLWLQLQADILDRPIYPSRTGEAAAVGAALLAGVGVGIYPDIQTARNQAVRWQKTVVYPNAATVGQYSAAYNVFCQLYPALRSAWDWDTRGDNLASPADRRRS